LQARSDRRVRSSSNALLMAPAALIVMAFLVMPVGYLLLLSFNPPITAELRLSADLTLGNYARLVADPFYLMILLRSVGIAAVTSVISAAMGYVLALSLWRASKSLKTYLAVVVLAPLLISVVVRTYGWMVILGDNGVLNNALIYIGIIEQPVKIMFTRLAIVIGLVHVFLPFMALSILSSLERIDPAIPEAATTLGAGAFAVHRDVIIPLCAPGFAAGFTIVFSLAISAYVTPMLMGSGATDMVTTLIYQQFMVVYNWHFGAALTMTLLLLTLLLLSLLLYAFSRYMRRWQTPR
jgi:putative spermidine/putrescine transport system permease protein